MDPTKKNKLEVNIQDCGLSQKVKIKLLENGIGSISDLVNLNCKQLKKLKGLGALGYAEVVFFLRSEDLKLKPVERVIDPLLGLKKKVISRLLKNDQPINWPRELKVAKELIKDDSNLDFWENFSLPFKLNTLHFLLTDRGREFLNKKPEQEKTKYSIPTVNQNQTILADAKFGEDIVCQKPKSIKDFLNGR